MYVINCRSPPSNPSWSRFEFALCGICNIRERPRWGSLEESRYLNTEMTTTPSMLRARYRQSFSATYYKSLTICCISSNDSLISCEDQRGGFSSARSERLIARAGDDACQTKCRRLRLAVPRTSSPRFRQNPSASGASKGSCPLACTAPESRCLDPSRIYI